MANLNFGNSPMARRRRNVHGQVEFTGETNVAAGGPRPQSLNDIGFYSVAGMPIDMETYRTMKRNASLPGSTVVQEKEAPYLGNGGGYLNGGVTQSTVAFPISEAREFPARPVPRAPERKIFYHPLGFTESADCRRLLPGINAAIENAEEQIKADHVPTGHDWALPRFVKAQKSAALWGDMQIAMRKVKGKDLQAVAPWCDARMYTPSVRQAPRQKGMRKSQSAGDVNVLNLALDPAPSHSSRHSSHHCSHHSSHSVAHSAVPDLMDFLRKEGMLTKGRR